MLVKSLLMPIVYIDFKLNQDYIAKVLCINRDKPEMQCNGHCVLMQKMTEAQDQTTSDENHAPEKLVLETFCEAIFEFQTLSRLFDKAAFITYSPTLDSSFIHAVFHPPQNQLT